jgi:acetyl esterase/lipase
MSLQMSAARLLLRLATKPRLARMSAEQAKRNTEPEPPAEIVGAHGCDVAELGGVRAVWLGRARAGTGTVVSLHGGSLVSGPYRAHWEHLARLAQATGLAGLLIDYRHAPQHPFPAALDDVVAALAAAEAANELTPGRWALFGGGATAGLAVAVCSRLRDAGRGQPSALVLSSPEFDFSLSNPALAERERADPVMTIAAGLRWNAAYIGDHDPRDPLISPLYGDPSGLPPALVQVGSTELLVPDVRAWCEKARAAGVEVTCVEERGAVHDFALASPRIPEARRAQADQAEFVSAALSRGAREMP